MKPLREKERKALRMIALSIWLEFLCGWLLSYSDLFTPMRETLSNNHMLHWNERAGHLREMRQNHGLQASLHEYAKIKLEAQGRARPQAHPALYHSGAGIKQVEGDLQQQLSFRQNLPHHDRVRYTSGAPSHKIMFGAQEHADAKVQQWSSLSFRTQADQRAQVAESQPVIVPQPE
jgi:hypothetical protein